MAAIQTFKQRSETAGKVGSLSSDVLVSGHHLLPPEMTFYKISIRTSITFQLTPCLADERALTTKAIAAALAATQATQVGPSCGRQPFSSRV